MALTDENGMVMPVTPMYGGGNGFGGGLFGGDLSILVLFFLFMIFAAVSTVIAVFENIIAFGMDAAGWSRKKSCAINLVLIAILALPCAFGFNIWSGFMPFGEGSNVLDLEDFIISNNIIFYSSKFM